MKSTNMSHMVDAMGYGAMKYGERMVDAIGQSRRLENAIKGRTGVDTDTRERLRTLIRWEGEGRIRLYGIDHGDMEHAEEATKKLMWYNTSGCWVVGAPLVIFQEHKYVFPSERIFAEIALALAAGVGQDG